MTDLEHAAYHEAGHTVAAYHCKRRFNYVTIVPYERAMGRVLWWRGAQLRNRVDRQREFGDAMSPRQFKSIMERLIFIELAGSIAAHIRFSNPEEIEDASCFSDIYIPLADANNISDWIGEISPDFDTNGIFNERLNRYLAFFLEPNNWAAVEALARALLERRRIGYLTAKKIIGEALQGNDTPRTVANV